MGGDVLGAELEADVAAEARAGEEAVRAVPADVVERVREVELAEEAGVDVELPAALGLALGVQRNRPKRPPSLSPTRLAPESGTSGSSTRKSAIPNSGLRGSAV